MERLTKRELINGKHVGCNIEIGQMNSCPDCNDSCMYGTCKWQEKANQKLKEYEDLEEQGLLLKLPCKVGDEFWELNAVNEPFIYPRKALTIQHCVYVLERLGKKAFLTKAEAEKALVEMERLYE